MWRQRRVDYENSPAAYQLGSAYKAVTRLILSNTILWNDPAPAVFIPRLSGVTQLRVDGQLSDMLAELLVTHMPSLDTLTVSELLVSEPSAALQCSWTRLVFTGKDSCLSLEDLADAPLPSGGRNLHVEVASRVDISAYVEGAVSTALTWQVSNMWYQVVPCLHCHLFDTSQLQCMPLCVHACAGSFLLRNTAAPAPLGHRGRGRSVS